MKKGTITAPDIAPGKKGSLQLVLPEDYKKYDALVLVAKDPHGDEIYRWTSTLRSYAQVSADFVQLKKDTTSYITTDSTITIRGGEVSVVLDKKTGQLITTRNSANDYVLSFNSGPVTVTGSSNCKTSSINVDTVGVHVRFEYDGSLQNITWTINSSGWTTLDYTYAAQGDQPFAGISFNYPENYVLGARWLGKGPGRQWKNRLKGTPINVWQNLYNNTHTGYAPLAYPEFKGYYGEVAWMELNTVEGKLYIASKDPGMYVRLLDFYALSSAGKPHPELPVGNISFLDAIPPIGTKLATGLTTNTKVYGPMSELNHLSGTKTRTLYFYFGMPKMQNTKELYSRPAIDNVF
jgi:hypothetical protein